MPSYISDVTAAQLFGPEVDALTGSDLPTLSLQRRVSCVGERGENQSRDHDDVGGNRPRPNHLKNNPSTRQTKPT